MAILPEEILSLVQSTLRELAEDLGLEGLGDFGPETRLYGQKSVLDSVALVSLIADLEEAVREHYGVDLVLADERSMDQRLTPFARVSTLVDFIVRRIEEIQK